MKNPFDDPVIKMLEGPLKRVLEPLALELRSKVYGAIIDKPPSSFYEDLGGLYDLTVEDMDGIWLIACRAAASKCQ